MRSTDMKMDTMPLKKRKFSHNIANIALVTNGNLNIIHTNEEEPNNTITPNDIVKERNESITHEQIVLSDLSAESNTSLEVISNQLMNSVNKSTNNNNNNQDNNKNTVKKINNNNNNSNNNDELSAFSNMQATPEKDLINLNKNAMATVDIASNMPNTTSKLNEVKTTTEIDNNIIKNVITATSQTSNGSNVTNAGNTNGANIINATNGNKGNNSNKIINNQNKKSTKRSSKAKSKCTRVSIEDHLKNPPWPFSDLDAISTVPLSVRVISEVPLSVKDVLRKIQKTSNMYSTFIRLETIKMRSIKKRKGNGDIDTRNVKRKSSRGLSNNDNSPPDISLISTLSKKSKKSNIVESKVKEKEIELPIKVKDKKMELPIVVQDKYTKDEYKHILKQLLEKNIIEPGDGVLSFKFEDNIISCALLNDGLLWFMDEMFNTIPEWMDYVTEPIKLIYKNDANRLKRVFFKDYSLHAWLQYSEALSTVNSSRKRQELTPLTYDLQNRHFKDNEVSEDMEEQALGVVSNNNSPVQKTTILKLKLKNNDNINKDGSVIKVKRGRGRPRKIPLDPTVAKIRRGRPRKIPLDPTVAKMKASKSKKTKKSRKDVEIVDEKADGDKGGEEEGEEEEEEVAEEMVAILSPYWRQTLAKTTENEKNYLQINIDAKLNFMNKISTAASVNFNTIEVVGTAEANKTNVFINRNEYETMKSFNLVVDAVCNGDETEHSANNAILKNGYHFLSNNILPEKMKPDKLEKMTKTLSTPNIDSLIMIPCQNYDGNNNNKSWKRRIAASSTRQSRTSVNTSILSEKQPFQVVILPEALFLGDIHAHLCTDEIIGLLGGRWDAEKKILVVENVFPCRELKLPPPYDQSVSVEMDPSSASEATNTIQQCGMTVVGWYHSHPLFQPSPSICDINNQTNYQNMFKNNDLDNTDVVPPYIGLIFTPYDAYSSRNRESRFNIFHTRQVNVNVDRRTTRQIDIPMRLTATPLQYVPVGSSVKSNGINWERTFSKIHSDNNNNTMAVDAPPKEENIINDIINSVIVQVEIDYARNELLSMSKFVPDNTVATNCTDQAKSTFNETQNDNNVLNKSDSNTNNVDKNKNPIEPNETSPSESTIESTTTTTVTADNAILTNSSSEKITLNDNIKLAVQQFTDKYGCCIESLVYQIVHLVLYYKKHKKKTKFGNKLLVGTHKNYHKKDKLLGSLLGHSKRLQIKSDELKNAFANDVVNYVVDQMKKEKTVPKITKKKQKKVATAQKMKEQTTPTTFTTTSTIITTTSTTDTTASTTATTTIIKKKHDKGKKSSTMSKSSDWDDYDKHIVQFLNYCYGKDWYERRLYGVRKKIISYLKKNVEGLGHVKPELDVTGNGMTKKLNNLKIYLKEEHGKSSNIFTNIITENFPLENVKELVKEWKV